MGRTVLDKFFEDIWMNPNSADRIVKQSTSGYPVTDIYRNEENNSQIIEMALAGFNRDMLKISAIGNQIQISSAGAEESGRSARIARRSFVKQFVDYKNELDFTKTAATFEDGLLKITIPAKVSATPHHIIIE